MKKILFVLVLSLMGLSLFSQSWLKQGLRIGSDETNEVIDSSDVVGGLNFYVGSQAYPIGENYSGNLTDDAPTESEINSVTSTTPAAAGLGWSTVIKDTNGDTALYYVSSTGTRWVYQKMSFAGGVPAQDPPSVSTPSTIPITHTQYYFTHPYIQDNDSIGVVHVNATDTLFADHTSYSYSIISGDAGSDFAISSVGMLRAADAADIISNGTTDYTLGVEIEANNGDKDTATCYVEYRSGTAGVTLFYIDPSDAGSQDLGTYTEPYKDFSNVNAAGRIAAGYTVLVKRGTQAYVDGQIRLFYNDGGARAVFAAYGKGAKPILENSTSEDRIFYIGNNTEDTKFDNVTICDFRMTSRNVPEDLQTYAVYKQNLSTGVHLYRLDIDSITGEHGAIYFRGKDEFPGNSRIYDCKVDYQPSADLADYDVTTRRAFKIEECGIDFISNSGINLPSNGMLCGVRRRNFGDVKYCYFSATSGTQTAAESGFQLRSQGSNLEYVVAKNFYNGICIIGGQGGQLPDANPINMTITNFITVGGTKGVAFYRESSLIEDDETFDNIVYSNGYIDQPTSTGLWLSVFNDNHELGDIAFNKIIVNRPGGYGLYIDHTQDWQGDLKINNSIFLGAGTQDIYVTGTMDADSIVNTIYDDQSGIGNMDTTYTYDFTTRGDPFTDAAGGDYTLSDTLPGYARAFTEDMLGNTIDTIDIGPIDYDYSSPPPNYNWTERSAGVGGGGGGTFYTDNFTGHPSGDLDGKGDWNLVTGRMDVYDNLGDKVVRPVNSGASSYYYFNQSLANDQYAEIVVDDMNTGRAIGVMVRGATGAYTGYYWRSDPTESVLVEISGGVVTTTHATGDAFVDGDTIRLSVTGTTISCYKNGALDTSIDGDGQVTDATISSGYAGLVTYGNGFSSYMDDFECGEN